MKFIISFINVSTFDFLVFLYCVVVASGWSYKYNFLSVFARIFINLDTKTKKAFKKW